MSISTITMASMPRSSEVAQINQNENNRAMLSQNIAQTAVQKNANIKSENVVKKEDALMQKNEKFDAREKGQNEYEYMYEKQKRKKEEQEGKVIIKGNSSFDIKV